MTLASVVALLQAALSLLTLVQSTPNIPQSLQTTAIQTAQQAISMATAQLSGDQATPPVSSNINSNANATQSSSTPENTVPSTVTYNGLTVPICTDETLAPETIATGNPVTHVQVYQNGEPVSICMPGGFDDFTLTPDSGPAPLTVDFSVNGVNNTINFGDGQSGTLSFSSLNTATHLFSISHTYASLGNYIVTMITGGGALVGTAEVTVTGSSTSQPSATIDQANSTVYATPTNEEGTTQDAIEGFSGSASGVSGIRLIVRNGVYTGPTDFDTASCSGTNVFGPYCANTPDTNPPGVYSTPVGYALPLGLQAAVSNGRWQTNGEVWNTANGATVPSTLTVLAYDGDTGPDFLQFLTETNVSVVTQ